SARPPRARRRSPPPAADPPGLPAARAGPASTNTRKSVMAVRIQKKITGYSVVTEAEGKAESARAEAAATQDASARPTAEVIHMHERIERPEVLIGSTYKIKSPLVEHAMYVTLNDIVLNAGTEHESRRPFEIFINSKSMEHFQWIVAL